MQLRDRLGRPLRGERINTDSFPQVPERDYISNQQTWEELLDYLDQGLPFHAHEVAEQRWRCAPSQEKLFWKACAQMGAALTHQARGNAIGAGRIALRARETLQKAGSPPREVDSVALEILFSTMLKA